MDVASESAQQQLGVMRAFAVYILANQSRSLYIGFTSDLLVRLHKHRTGCFDSHTRRFNITRLVYFEQYADARTAIMREKQLKRWPRWRKIRLIEHGNYGWRDLSRDLFPDERRCSAPSSPGEG